MHPNQPDTTELPTFTGTTITVQLSSNDQGNLVVRLPAQANLIGGNITLLPGTVEQSLRDILSVEQKIAKHVAQHVAQNIPIQTSVAVALKLDFGE